MMETFSPFPADGDYVDGMGYDSRRILVGYLSSQVKASSLSGKA